MQFLCIFGNHPSGRTRGYKISFEAAASSSDGPRQPVPAGKALPSIGLMSLISSLVSPRHTSDVFIELADESVLLMQ
jgi:hypothetical protein